MRHRLLPVLLALVLFAGCVTSRPAPQPDPAPPFSLRILHVNDHHARLAPTPGQTLRLGGQDVTVTVGGFPRIVTAFRELARDVPNVLTLHAGDALTGDLYYTLFEGEADADLMNQICFDAFVVGNHEFDHGDRALQRFLDYLTKRTWSCQTPALGANVVPAAGRSPLARFGPRDYLLPHVIVERGGRRIGIIGIDVQGKTMNASSPDEGTVLLDELETARAHVDALRAQGVEHLILLTHVGYENDLALAAALPGVDVIVGGDSHSLLGEPLREVGLPVEGPYPTVLRNLDGDPVCVVQAWQYAWVAGQLDVQFDDRGRVAQCAGTPHLLLDDTFRVNGQPVSAARQDSLRAVIARTEGLRIVAPDSASQRILDFYAAQIDRFASEQVGFTPEPLCLRRVPGPFDRSRDATPGCAEATDIHGGFSQAIVARAFLTQGQRFGGADVALQNAGGVRSPIPQGPFTVGTAYQVLPFKNTLVRLTMTGAEVKATLTAAFDFFRSDPGSNSGAYPYAANLRWHTDLSIPAGFRDLEVYREGAWMPVTDTDQIRVIVNDYIAGGKDGYGPLAQIPPDRVENTFLDYAQALLDYVREGGALVRPAREALSTQSFRTADGSLFAP